MFSKKKGGFSTRYTSTNTLVALVGCAFLDLQFAGVSFPGVDIDVVVDNHHLEHNNHFVDGFVDVVA